MANAAETLAALDAEREFLAACIKVQQPFEDAKAAYRDALDGDDEEAIAAAKERKNAAALAVRSTRQWLRREDRLRALPGQIDKFQRMLDARNYEDDEERDRIAAHVKALREELPVLQAVVDETRSALVALGAEIVVPPPAADDAVVVSPAPVKVRARKAGGV